MVGTVGLVWYLCVCYLLVLLVSLVILSPCSWLRDPLKHTDLSLAETYSCHRHGIAEQGRRARTIGLSARVRRELPRWTRTREPQPYFAHLRLSFLHGLDQSLLNIVETVNRCEILSAGHNGLLGSHIPGWFEILSTAKLARRP
ncbi:hypothetical protein EV127DRAFT_50172 [Xylaria flabelliformis]|nr:hypothetical protein EV127DRAFT_50172 [Xylaria flabelliformis]